MRRTEKVPKGQEREGQDRRNAYKTNNGGQEWSLEEKSKRKTEDRRKRGREGESEIKKEQEGQGQEGGERQAERKQDQKN